MSSSTPASSIRSISRNILVQTAVDRLIDARWTDDIHNEWIRNLAANEPAVPLERLGTTRRLMNAVLPTATIVGYERHILGVNLPDSSDRHVVSAGIAANAAIILTWNLRDFPAAKWGKFGLKPMTPDALLADVYDKAPDLATGSLAKARRNLTRNPASPLQFIEILVSQRLTDLADRIRSRLTDI